MTDSGIIFSAGIPTIESMLLHRQLRGLGHIIIMPHSRLPHCVLFGQLRLGRRSVGGQREHFKDHIKSILKKCNIPFSRLETLASKRATWRSTCVFGISYFDDEYDRAAALRRSSRHQHTPVFCPIPILIINAHFVADNAYHALTSLATARPTFNVEEEVVVIRNGWTPKNIHGEKHRAKNRTLRNN